MGLFVAQHLDSVFQLAQEYIGFVEVIYRVWG